MNIIVTSICRRLVVVSSSSHRHRHRHRCYCRRHRHRFAENKGRFILINDINVVVVVVVNKKSYQRKIEEKEKVEKREEAAGSGGGGEGRPLCHILGGKVTINRQQVEIERRVCPQESCCLFRLIP